jgi:hypothetical protein
LRTLPFFRDNLANALALGSAVLALAGSISGALAATIQIPVNQCAPNQQSGFNPASQLPARCELKDGSVLKSHVNADHLELSIKRPALPEVTISLPASFAQLDRIIPAQGNEAVLLGMVSGDVDGVVMVDTVNCRVVDFFWCYQPAVSPDGQWIAFIKFFPPHFVSGVSDFAMLYDLTRSAAGNRPSGVLADDQETVGTRVYPPGRNTEGDNAGLPETDLNAVGSGFFWAPDSSKVLFANQRAAGYQHRTAPQPGNAQKGAARSGQVALSLVLVKMAVSHEKPQVTVFPIRQCPGECKPDLSSVEFAPDGVRAQFEEPGTHRQQSLEVKYAEFRAPWLLRTPFR